MSHDIQNQIIELMSTIVTEQIVKDVGESWFTLKVDGTKDPTGSENVSIVVRYRLHHDPAVFWGFFSRPLPRDLSWDPIPII